jgi:protein-S-isoprenylcysteine O-methyltransferase Ste14
MRNALTLLLGLFILVFSWFVVPVYLIRLNVIYGLPFYTNSLQRSIGFVFFLFGFSATLYNIHQHLLTGRITPLIIESPKKLIDKGFYRYSRNPMYISILLAFVGIYMIFGYLLLLAYFFFALILFHLVIVYKEEPELKKKFGKEYTSYMKKVPRWFSFKY